jgi:hypothetical protein
MIATGTAGVNVLLDLMADFEAPTPVTRHEALATGLRYYLTGKPCPSGHVTHRRVSSGSCTACDLERAKRYHAANRDAINARRRTRAV